MKKQPKFKIDLIDFTKLKDGSGMPGELIKFSIVALLGSAILVAINTWMS